MSTRTIPQFDRWQARAIELEAESDRLKEALGRIDTWADAYPVEQFPQQDMKRAREVLEAAGLSIGAMHGEWARHLIGGIGGIAKAALRDK